MEIFTTILAYGYIFIVGFVFLIMVFQILAFFIAGRVTGSINDELISAFTLFGALLLVGVASTLINAVLSTFLPGMLAPAVLAFILYLVAIVYAVVMIYELSIGKSILYLLLSFVITAVLTGLLVFLATLAFPQGGFEVDFTDELEIDSMFETFDTMEFEEFDDEPFMEEEEPLDETEEVSEGLVVEEVAEEEVELDTEEPTEDDTPSSPTLPDAAE